MARGVRESLAASGGLGGGWDSRVSVEARRGGHLQSPGEATAPVPSALGLQRRRDVLQGQVGPACRMGLDREGAAHRQASDRRDRRTQGTAILCSVPRPQEDGRPLHPDLQSLTLHSIDKPLATMDMLPGGLRLRPGSADIISIETNRKQCWSFESILTLSIRISNYYQLLSFCPCFNIY